MLGSEKKSYDVDVFINNILASVNLTTGDTINFDKFFELFSGNEGLFDQVNLEARGGRKLVFNLFS